MKKYANTHLGNIRYESPNFPYARENVENNIEQNVTNEKNIIFIYVYFF